MKPEDAPLAELRWSPTYRLVPSRFPPVDLFERVAAPEDLEVVFALEALTNPRLRQEVGEISLVPREERVGGPGTSPIMAAFTHLNPYGSRFSAGHYGVYYAARALQTAVREVSHHQAIFLAATREPPITIDLRCYRTAEDMEAFYEQARAVSALTYQERLLRAGLPEGPEELAEMRALAARDQARGWLLWLDGRPISYLYAPAEGETLLYAFLGYDPAFAALSPGNVLQLEVMRQLMDERRFRRFDFAEGEGRHKALFATGAVDCVDLLLLRPTFANLAAGRALTLFDGAVELAKRLLRR